MTSILSKLLPSFGPDADDIDEEQEAKQQRIDFHRRSVRNGPVSFKTPTNGQLRRAEKRRMDKKMKRSHRAQVHQHFSLQREGAILRGHLAAVGVMELVVDCPRSNPLNQHAAYTSTLELVKRFAPAEARVGRQVTLTEDVVRASFKLALNRWQKIVGLPPTDLPASYELPVQAAA